MQSAAEITGIPYEEVEVEQKKSGSEGSNRSVAPPPPGMRMEVGKGNAGRVMRVAFGANNGKNAFGAPQTFTRQDKNTPRPKTLIWGTKAGSKSSEKGPKKGKGSGTKGKNSQKATPPENGGAIPIGSKYRGGGASIRISKSETKGGKGRIGI